MSDAGSAPLHHTPFYDLHVAAGAKMVPFAGWEMPVQYTGGLAEHKAVRESCGLFDVSHMGEFIVTGPDHLAFVNYVTTNDVNALAVGQVQYSALCNERGTIEDDCLVYRYANGIMLVVNASNRDKDLAHITQYAAKFDVAIADVSDGTALLALQGPNAEAVLQPLVTVDLAPVGYYRFVEGTVAGVQATISRTGYTGEDGFELYFDPAHATVVWNALMHTGKVTLAGLGARDTLRLEMGFALYGNDIDDTTTPLEAGLGWITKLPKGDFVGRAALEAQKAAGIPRKLVAFTLPERNIARHGMPVFVNGEASGTVCSGTLSPSVNIPIGTAYVPTAHAKVGNTFEVEIRGKRVTATIAKAPFYANASHK
jgi:aminomethyltransferase